MPEDNATCEVCSKSFYRSPAHLRRVKHTYCSSDCQTIASRNVPNYACCVCGTPIYRRDWEVKERMYCSHKCQGADIRKLPNTTCAYCGKELVRRGYSLQFYHASYCDHNCASKGRLDRVDVRCDECGIEFEKHRCELRVRNYCCIGCRQRGVVRVLSNNTGNKLEMDFQKEFPSLRYVGSGDLWLKDEQGYLCPDFIHPGTNFLVELWGDYWHANQNPQERIDRLARLGYECIVVWESDFRKRLDQVRQSIL